MSHVTRIPLSRSKGQGHQVALLSAALTRNAAAAVSVGTYSAWESILLRCVCSAAREGLGAHGGGQGRGHFVSPRAQFVRESCTFRMLQYSGCYIWLGQHRQNSSCAPIRIIRPRRQDSVVMFQPLSAAHPKMVTSTLHVGAQWTT